MNSRYLVTLKPEQYLTPQHAYATLAEIDWQTQAVIRTLRFPSASYSDDGSFMAPLAGGVCTVGNRIFVALWNFIVEVDYDSFQIVNSFSHPYMGDLHGITTDGSNLYVAATSIDALLCFDIDNFELQWRWGPDEPILYEDRVRQIMEARPVAFLPFVYGRRLFTVMEMQKFVDRDYRHVRKGYTGYHNHHLNDAILHESKLYITTKQWNTHLAGAVIELDLVSRESRFFIPPDSLQGLHDGVWIGERFYVTESGANRVAWREPDGKLVHKEIQPENYFVRGLCDTGGSWLVGFTTQRGTQQPALIVEFDRDFNRTIQTMDVSTFYPPTKSTAIHAIIHAPDEG